jgi:hypothetical protein
MADPLYRTQNKKRGARDLKTRKWLNKKTKTCPGCGWGIEKNQGCDYITCESNVCVCGDRS